MMLSLTPTIPKLITTAALACIAGFSPPRIHVTVVGPRDTAPAGTVLLVEGHRHVDSEPLTITGRAEGVQNGRRVSLPLTMASAGPGKYGVTRQWISGSPWLLILTAGQGDHGTHGIAEALVKIDTAGEIVGIDYPAAGWIGNSETPKRTTAAEIDAVLATLATRR